MKITVNDPRLPAGYEVALTGLNMLLINGQENEVDDELVADFKARTGKDLSAVIATSRRFGGTPKPKPESTTEVTTTEPVQVYEDHPFITTDTEGGEEN